MTNYKVETRSASHLVGGGKKAANVLWFIFFGLWVGIEIIFMAVAYCCTLIFIPVGIQLFKLPKLVFKPFDKDVNTRFGKHGFLNVVWLIFGGLVFWFIFKIIALFLKLTFVGAGVGRQVDKLAQFLLAPFGAEIVAAKEYTSDVNTKAKVHDSTLVMRRAAANTGVKINTAEGKMTVAEYFKSKKPEMEYEARSVIQNLGGTIFWGILTAGLLGLTIFLNTTAKANFGVSNLGALYVLPGIVGAWFIWQVVARAAKIYLKCYQKQMKFLGSKFDEKIDLVCYKKFLMNLPEYYGEESDVTKKLHDGSVRGLFRAIGEPMDVVSKKAKPSVEPNSIVSRAKEVSSSEKGGKAETKAPERNKLDDLKQLKELLDSGVITQEEFDKKKEEILKSI